MNTQTSLAYASMLENPTLIQSTYFILDSDLTITSSDFSLETDKIIVVKPPSPVLRKLKIISEFSKLTLSYQEVIFKSYARIYISQISTVEIPDCKISSDLHLIEELNLGNNDQESLSLDSTKVYLFGRIFKEKGDFIQKSWAGFFIYVTDQMIPLELKPLKNFGTVEEYMSTNSISADEEEDIKLYLKNAPSLLELICSDKYQIKSDFNDLDKLREMVWLKCLSRYKEKTIENPFKNFRVNKTQDKNSGLPKDDLKSLLNKIRELGPEDKEDFLNFIKKKIFYSQDPSVISYRNINLFFSVRQRISKYKKFIIDYNSLTRNSLGTEHFESLSLIEEENDFLVYVEVPFSAIPNYEDYIQVISNISSFANDKKNLYFLMSNISSPNSIIYIYEYLKLFENYVIIDHYSSFLFNDLPEWKNHFFHSHARPSKLLNILRQFSNVITLDSENICQNLCADIVLINRDISACRNSPIIISAKYIIVESENPVILTITSNYPEFILADIVKVIGGSKLKILFRAKDLVWFISPLSKEFIKDPNYYILESLKIDSKSFLDLVVYVNDNFGRINTRSDIDLAVKNTNIQFSFFLRHADFSTIGPDDYLIYPNNKKKSEVFRKYLENFPTIFELLLTKNEYFREAPDFLIVQDILLSNLRKLGNTIYDILSSKFREPGDTIHDYFEKSELMGSGDLFGFLNSLGTCHKGNSLIPFLRSVEVERNKLSVIFKGFCFLYYLCPEVLEKFRVIGSNKKFKSKRVEEYENNNSLLCSKLRKIKNIEYSKLEPEPEPKKAIDRSKKNKYIDKVFWFSEYNL